MTTKISKFPARQQLFCQRVAAVYGCSPEAIKTLFGQPRQQSWRQCLGTALDSAQPIDWAAQLQIRGYYLTSDSRPQVLKLQQQGRAIIQNASSWLPPAVLAPRPNERILDMCAAPGAKTLLLAELADNQAELVANELSPSRASRMKRLLELYRVGNYQLCVGRGEALSRQFEDQSFDAILLDAPCSGEGLINLSDNTSLDGWSLKAIERLAQQQRRLLKTAWRLLKPGGRLVYSTCTVAPEENELQIHNFIKLHDDAEVEPITLPDGVPRGPFVQFWRQKTLYPAVQNCWRVPHGTIFEAFFIAKIVKKG